MKLRHTDIVIDESNPFLHCKLNRGKYAEVLTELVGTYADGFVLAINNEWGTGKTTFVKMWQQYLIRHDFQTIYFNAWENDFDKNPLVALMSELKDITNNHNQQKYQSVVEKGSILLKNVAPALVKAVVKKYIDTEEITDAIENTAKGVTEIFEEEIKEYKEKKKSIIEFRDALKQYVKTTNGKPVVFIIDELDRCRPTYAVELLEEIKHFCTVEGIVFVLSIDKNHLASSVKGYYGSEHINTDEYLRRFIDLEYTIPKPSVKEFSEYLYEYYSFSDFLESEERRKIDKYDYDKRAFLKTVELLFESTDTTLRQLEKVFALTRITLNTFHQRQHVFTPVLFFLVYLKTVRHTDYKNIEDGRFTVQQLSDLFTSHVIGNNMSKTDGLNRLFQLAMLLYFYNSNKKKEDRENLFALNGNISTTYIETKLETGDNTNSLAHWFNYISQSHEFYDFKIKYLIDKINLVEGFKSGK